MDEQCMNNNIKEAQALKVTHGGQYTGRGSRRGSFRGRCHGKGKQSFDKATLECYAYSKLGHYQWEYPTWNRER